MRQLSWASVVTVMIVTTFVAAPDRAWSAIPPGAINSVQAGGLQAALDALPATGGTIFIPAGRHVFAKPVMKRLQEGQHLFLVGEGRASVLVNENQEGQELLQIVGIVGQSWPDLKITIRDLTFLGNHQSGDALVVDHPNDTMIDGCFFQGHGGKAICFRNHGTNATCRDCWIRDCKRGLYAENVHHLTIHGVQTRSLKDGQELAEQEERVQGPRGRCAGRQPGLQRGRQRVRGGDHAGDFRRPRRRAACDLG